MSIAERIRYVLHRIPFLTRYRPKCVVHSTELSGKEYVSELWRDEGHAVEMKEPVLNDSRFFCSYASLVQRKTKDQFVLRMEHGSVWGRDGAVVTPDREFVEDVSRQFGTGGVAAQHAIFRKLRISRPLAVRGKVAVVTTAGSEVYYHWMLDILPRILVLRELGLEGDIDHFVLNYAEKKFQTETMQMLDIPVEKLLIPSRSEEFHIRAEQLIVPSLPSELNQVNAWECGLVAKYLGSHAALVSPVSSASRIYISRRRAGNRVVKNEAELYAYLETCGFVEVEMENYSVSEQMRIFSDARVIVGAHGSAFANIVFCQKGASLVDLLPASNVVSCFYGIAGQLGLNYFGFIDAPVKEDAFVKHDSVLIDLPKFRTFMEERVLVSEKAAYDFDC